MFLFVYMRKYELEACAALRRHHEPRGDTASERAGGRAELTSAKPLKTRAFTCSHEYVVVAAAAATSYMK